jgi:hypothetical protein
MVTRYTDEERQRIYDAARAAIEGAERTLESPRPELAEWNIMGTQPLMAAMRA